MTFAASLLRWFAHNGRHELPWRVQRSPYRTVVSEFMLQQTQVERVAPAFERFVARWPSFEALAAASQADVVREWKGLGYNSRAVRLHGLARVVCERFCGRLPDDEAGLRELPGIGPYTARAIAAFAFGRDVAALDTNVARVVHRTQLGLEWPRRATEAELAAIADALVPPGAGFAFNSAMMDLGAAICTARAPGCASCPVRAHCAAAPVDAAALAARARAYARPRAPQERLRFEQTVRHLRGRIVDRLRELPPDRRISLLDLQAGLASDVPHHDSAAIAAAVAALARERLVDDSAGGLSLF